MSTLREILFLLVGAIVPAAVAIFVHPQLADRERAGLRPLEVRLETVADWGDSVLWIDARSPEEFARQTIPGARHFDFDQFDKAIGEILLAWSPNKPIVVFCSAASCTTSEAIARRLREAGLDDVYFLHGGWEAWLAAN